MPNPFKVGDIVRFNYKNEGIRLGEVKAVIHNVIQIHWNRPPNYWNKLYAPKDQYTTSEHYQTFNFKLVNYYKTKLGKILYK